MRDPRRVGVERAGRDLRSPRFDVDKDRHQGIFDPTGPPGKHRIGICGRSHAHSVLASRFRNVLQLISEREGPGGSLASFRMLTTVPRETRMPGFLSSSKTRA